MTILVNGLLPQAISADGWTATNEAWAYASATTITVPTGAATRYAKGMRIRLTQLGSVAYFVVVAVADTLLTITAGTTYTLSNNPISAVSYSHQGSPVGYPVTFGWTPGFTGFSANPTVIAAGCWFRVDGNVCTFNFQQNGLGTSNATTFTITGLPVAAATAVTTLLLGAGANNSANLADSVTGALLAVTGAISGTTLTMTIGSGPWTASGTKGLYNAQFAYPI